MTRGAAARHARIRPVPRTRLSAADGISRSDYLPAGAAGAAGAAAPGAAVVAPLPASADAVVDLVFFFLCVVFLGAGVASDLESAVLASGAAAGLAGEVLAGSGVAAGAGVVCATATPVANRPEIKTAVSFFIRLSKK